MKIINSAYQFNFADGIFAPYDRVLVAVSGGADSVALLRLLIELRDELQLHLEVAHLQHGIRGEEAREDARFVAGLADQFGLTFHFKEVSVPEIRAAAGKGNLEALARHERYRFFAEVAHARGLQKVAIAHTLDDQAETVLMRFLRGSGLKGIGGMAPLQVMNSIGSDSLPSFAVIRPLLQVTKAEILNYLAVKHQAYRTDRTNQDTALLRNWVRLELLAKIRERVDGRLAERLGQQAELMRDEDVVLGELARHRLGEISTADGLSRVALLAEPIAMRRRLLRLWIETARGNLRGMDFVQIDDLLRLINDGPPQGRLAIRGGWELLREYETLKLIRRSVRIERKCYSYNFTLGSSLQIPEAGGELQGELVKPPIAELPGNLSEAVFDAVCLTGPLTVRNFRHGDYFHPLGMTGRKKIKDLFIDNKVALSVRARLPLLILGQEVIWVPGYGRSTIARVSADTKSILRLKLVTLGT
jgi:tRNA(Ile)-lysidine synthase